MITDSLKGTKLEHNIFVLLCKISLLASSIFFIVDFFFTQDWISVGIEVVVACLSFVLLRRAQKLGRIPVNRYLFTLVFLLIANLAWITGGGYSVVNFMVYFLIVFSTILILPRKAIFALSAFSLLNISALYLYEQLMPEFFTQFGVVDDPLDEFMLIVVPFAVGIMLSYNIKKFYLSEYSIINEQNNQLTRNKSELEENQKRLNETLNNYTNLLDNAIDGIIVINPEGEIIEYANTKACELYELGVEDFGIISMKSFSAEDYNDEVTMEKFISDGKLRNFKTRHTSKNGKKLEIEFNATWTYFNGRKRILSINRDISERTRLERELKQSHDLYKLLAEYSSNIITLHDRNNRIEYVSPFADHLLGYTQEYLKNSSYFDIIHPDDKPDILAEMEKGIKERQEFGNYEYRVRKSNGEYIWVESRIHRSFDNSGSLKRSIVNSSNITDRKLTQQKLEESNELYQLLAENSGDIITLYDTDFHLEYVSPSVKDVLGFSVEEFKEVKTFSRIHPNDLEELKVGLQKTIDRKIPRNILRYRYKKSSGSYIWLEILVKPMFDKNKQLIGFTSVARDVNELVEKETNLLRISEDLKEAQEIAKLGNISIDLITNTVYWSERTYKILEVQPDKKPFRIEEELLHADDMELWRENHARILEEGTGDCQVRIITPEGNLKYVHIKTRLVRDYYIPTKIVGTIQDITAEKEIQKEISEKEKLLASIIENDPSMIFMKSLDGEFAVMNSGAAHKLYGRKPEEVIGKKHHELHEYPTESEFILRQERVLKDNWKSVKYEIEYTSPVYGKIYVDMTKIPFEDSNGKKYILGIGIDITKLKVQQKQLQLAQERYELATRAGQTAIADWMPLEDRIFFDSEFQNLLGYNKNEIPNDSPEFLKYFVPEDAGKFVDDVIDHIKSGKKDFQGEYQLYHKNGDLIWLLVRGKSFYNDEGMAIRMVGSATDITEIKEYELELINTKMELEHASKAKENFFSVMSHEIRTPLNSIIGLSHVLSNKNPSEEQMKVLQVLRDSSDHLYRLINDILDYNKIRAGQMIVQKTGFEIRDFLDRNCLPYKVEAEEKGIEFEVDIDGIIPKVLKADVFRIKQILDNIFNNAMKFTDSGKISFSVTALKADEETILLKFLLTDTGIGIPQEELGNILEPFRQVTGNPKNNTSGTGLGLSIVKNLVDLLEGSMSINSEHGKGTEVNIVLPFEHEAKPKPVKQHIEASSTEDNPSLNGLKILYVEDVASNQFVIESYCSMWGIECQTVNSGKEAIQKLRNEKYDFVLMDLHMPEMDGYETSKCIRHDLELTEIPIIAFTADVSDSVRERVRKSEMNGLISKPVDGEKLYSMMAQISVSDSRQCDEDALLDLSFYQQLASDRDKPWEVIKSMIIDDFEVLKSKCLEVKNSRDWEELRKALHRIRPVASNIKFHCLLSTIDEIKQHIKSEETEKLDSKLEEILTHIEDFEQFSREEKEVLST